MSENWTTIRITRKQKIAFDQLKPLMAKCKLDCKIEETTHQSEIFDYIVKLGQTNLSIFAKMLEEQSKRGKE